MRPTRDVVILIFAAAVAAVVVVSIAGLIAIEIFHPDTDTDPYLEVAWNVAALMAGTVVGYLVAAKLRNGNGRNGHGGGHT